MVVLHCLVFVMWSRDEVVMGVELNDIVYCQACKQFHSLYSAGAVGVCESSAPQVTNHALMLNNRCWLKCDQPLSKPSFWQQLSKMLVENDDGVFRQIE